MQEAFVSYSPIQEQKNFRVEMCQKNVKMLQDGCFWITSRRITVDEAFAYSISQISPQEFQQWAHEDEPAPAEVKSSRTISKVIYVVFFRSTRLGNAVRLDT